MINCGKMNLVTSFLKNIKRKIIGRNQLKLEVYDSNKKDENITTKFEPQNNEDIVTKAYLDTKLSKIEGQISNIKKDYNEFKLHNKEDILIGRAGGTTIQISNNKGFFDIYKNGNAHEVLQEYLLVNKRRRPDLEEVKDVILYFYS